MFEGFEEPNNKARSELLNETFEMFFTEDYRNSIKERYGDDIKIRKIAITKNKQSHQFGIRISKNKNKSSIIPHYFIEFNEFRGLKVGFQFSNWGDYTPSFQIFRNAASKDQKIIDDFIKIVFGLKNSLNEDKLNFIIKFPYDISEKSDETIELIVNEKLFQESPSPTFKFYILINWVDVLEDDEFKDGLIDYVLKFKRLHDYCFKVIDENKSEEVWEEDEEPEEVDKEISISGYTEDKINEFISAIKHKKAVILYGPPGTSKTFFAMEFASQFVDDKTKYQKIQFHPSLSYEDFIAGIDVQLSENQISYAKIPKIFVNFCKKAKNDPKESIYILIIDEINRGNISSIFGELIYLIEKRGEENAITIPLLPDDDNEFYIPENLYIIGTMNTTDRSIAFLDFALRRRFFFIPFLPDSQVLEEWLQEKCEDKDLAERISKIFEIFNRKITESHLDENFQIGHTYFMCKNRDEFIRSWQYSIFPLLKEYFYEDSQQLDRFKKLYKDFLSGSEEEEFKSQDSEEKGEEFE